MGRLIDVVELEQRVKAHLGEELNLNHITLMDVIALLCDELEETNQQFADFVMKYNELERINNLQEERLKLLTRKLNGISGKPDWMK